MSQADNIKSTVHNVLRSHKGFSLTELLVTLVLVGLISAAVAGGISMVARSYTKVVDRADAEQLLSTTVSRITDELSYAREYATEPITVSADKKTVDFVSGLTGMRVRITAGSGAEDSLHMYYYFKDNPSADDWTEIPMVDSKMKTRMSINYNTINYDDGKFVIVGFNVTLKGKNTPIVAMKNEDGTDYEYTVARING